VWVLADKDRYVLCVGVNPAFDMTVELDGLDDDRVNRVMREYCEAAGKAANVACGLAAEGVNVCLTGFYGEDNYDQWSAFFKERSHGAVKLIPVMCSGATRKNTTLLAEGRTVKINYSGCMVDGAAQDELFRLVSNASGVGHIAVFTGSLPPGMTCDQYLVLIKKSAAAGARVVIDTDRLSMQEILSAKPWIYKPNAHELASISGVDAEDDDRLISFAQQLAGKGVGIVLLTLGSRGLAAITAEQVVRIPAQKVNAVNTVGAGDAALAAFIAAQMRSEPLEECALKAVEAGALAVTKTVNQQITRERYE